MSLSPPADLGYAVTSIDTHRSRVCKQLGPKSSETQTRVALMAFGNLLRSPISKQPFLPFGDRACARSTEYLMTGKAVVLKLALILS